MEKENKLLLSAKRWQGPDEEDGMHDVTAFFLARNGQKQFLKSAHQTFDEDGNKKTLVVLRSLDCGHSVDDPREAVMVNEKLCCRECAKRCPCCGDLIEPGKGEQVEQVWYHRTCAASPREHFELKRFLEEGFQAARLEAAKLQGELTEAQIGTAKANVRVQDARLQLEKKREKVQRGLIAAQAHAVYGGLRLQEERLSLEEGVASERAAAERLNLALQSERLWLEDMHVRERIRLEQKASDQKQEALESQLASEKVQRAISGGRFRLEWAERVAKLEDQGHVPEGTARRSLP